MMSVGWNNSYKAVRTFNTTKLHKVLILNKVATIKFDLNEPDDECSNREWLVEKLKG
jgi:hypothetical protein